MESRVVDIFCHDRDELEEFESLTDGEIRSAMGGFGAIKRIYRWKSSKQTKKLKPPHLFIEYNTLGSSKAAARLKNEKWVITYLHTSMTLYQEYLEMRKKPRSFACWGPDAEEEQTSSDESSDDKDSGGSAAPSSSSAPRRSATPTADRYRPDYWTTQSVPFTYASADPLQPTYPRFVFPSDSPSVTPMSPDLPSTHPTRRSRDPEEDRQSPAPYKRQRSVGPNQLESILLVQERLKQSELKSRAQDAEAKNAALEKRTARLEGEKKGLEILAVEQAERYANLELQMGQTLARELEMQDRMAAREAELKSRCDMLEVQLEQVRQNQLETSKEKEEMKRMVDGAYLVPSLKDAFVQIDQLFRGLVDRPVEFDQVPI